MINSNLQKFLAGVSIERNYKNSFQACLKVRNETFKSFLATKILFLAPRTTLRGQLTVESNLHKKNSLEKSLRSFLSSFQFSSIRRQKLDSRIRFAPMCNIRIWLVVIFAVCHTSCGIFRSRCGWWLKCSLDSLVVK